MQLEVTASIAFASPILVIEQPDDRPAVETYARVQITETAVIVE